MLRTQYPHLVLDPKWKVATGNQAGGNGPTLRVTEPQFTAAVSWDVWLHHGIHVLWPGTKVLH